MADVKMPDSIPCQFDAGGWNPCEKPSDNGWCSEHEGLECASCGKQATTSCDAQMGGLACGVNLCDGCTHGPDNTHITREAHLEIRRKQDEEREARVASRTNPAQRMNEELGVPLTLFELLKGDWEGSGFKLGRVYFLELRHGLMGFFPAIFSSDEKRIVFTTSLELLKHVWETLDPRDANLRTMLAYVNEERHLFYIETDNPEDREDEEPRQYMTSEEFSSLSGEEKPFKWAFGLIGGRCPSKEHFLADLSKQAKALMPTFAGSPA